MLEEEKTRKINTIREEIDSGSYKSRRSVYSAKYSSNVDYLVDKVLTAHYGKQRIKGRLPYKKILSTTLALFVILAVIPYILPPIYGGFDTDVSVVLDHNGVRVNETLFINVTIPSYYNITQVRADMAGVETIDLMLVNTPPLYHFWQGVWVVHSVVPGEHIMTIMALDANNTSYSAGVRLSVISDEVPVDNQSIEPDDNATTPPYNETIPSDIDEGNGTSNETVPADIVDDEISNETIIPASLNLTLNSNKNSYEIDETMLIEGFVTYNNSLINASINLTIMGPGYNSTISLNASNGRFNYKFVPVVVGSYMVQAVVSYLNETVQDEVVFDVQAVIPPGITPQASELSVWDDTDYQVRYEGDQVTFYANYSSFNQSIKNATSLISFNIEYWTEPATMSYSDGIYVYSRSFDTGGTYDFRVWCSVSGIENETMLSDFVVSEVVGNFSEVSIVDTKVDERVYVLPGTSFYVERTVDGPSGADVVFAPLYSDGLTIEKFEILRGNEATGLKDCSPQEFFAGRGVSNLERRIDGLREVLPVDIKSLNRVSYSQSFTIQDPCTVRIWFKAPSWEEITSGLKPFSGKISYLTFSNNGSNGYDYESSTWWNSNWYYRKLITINSSQVDTDLTNFPILVNTTDTDLRDDAQDDGDDIAFVLWSDNSTQANHEIELFNSTTGELVCWVNVTSLSSSEDTKIWMYYGNSGCSNQQNKTGVWDSNYVMVQHMNETSGLFYDSTIQGNNGTFTDVDSDSVRGADGNCNGAVDFTGDADYISANGVSADVAGKDFTLMIWINSETQSGQQFLASFNTNTGGNRLLLGHPTNNPDLQIYDGGWRDSNDQMVDGNWHLVGYTFNDTGNSVDAYIDGAHVLNYGSSSSIAANDLFSIAMEYDGGPSASDFWNGFIDEVRISDIIRTTSWITTSYNTMMNKTTFLNVSTEEKSIPGVSDPVPSNGSTGVSVPPTSFNITISDPNGDNMNITWLTNTSGSWKTFNVTDGGGSGVGDGTYNTTNTSWVNSFATKHWWSVNVTDGTMWKNTTYTFTTNYHPQLSNPDPINGSISEVTPICSITISDQDGGNVTVRFYENSTGPWVLQQTNNNIDVSSPNTIEWDNYSNATLIPLKYWWKVNVSDDIGGFVEEIYHFTTVVNNPPVLSFENPVDLSTGIPTSLSVINVTIEDPEGDGMDWSIETGPDIGNNSGSGASNGSISCSVSGLSTETMYYWYVNVTDGELSTNETYSFTTSYSPTMTLIIPSPNGTTGVSLQPTCKIWVNDTDGDNLNVTWAHNISGSFVNQHTNISETANSTVSYQFLDFTNYSKSYYWKIYLDDGSSNISEWFYFTTEKISTSVDAITPYTQIVSPLIINATGISDLSNVTLWYSYSEDNSTWWNTSWLRRKPISLNVSSGTTPANYQVELNITYDNDMQNDFSDLRFVNHSGSSIVLDYWIEDKSDGNWALVWVEISDNITTNNQTIAWMYYGNSDASSASNADNTFVLFDDFLGTSYDDTIWGTNFESNVVISGGMVALSGDWNTGGHYFATDNSFASPIIAQTRARLTSISSDMDLSFGFQNNQNTEWWTDANCVWCLFDSNGGGAANAKTIKTDGTSDTGNEATSTAWETHIIEYLGGTTNWYDSNLGWLNTSRSTYSPFYFSLASDTDSASVAYIDYVFLRNYSSNTPTYSIGSENSWMEWNNVANPDLNAPWSWNFDFPSDNGYYEFYSIGKKLGSVDETAPNNADTRCHYNPNTSINVTPAQWDIGTTTVGNYNYSTSGFYFNLTNEGNVALNIQIKASNATNATTGAQWELSSTPSLDNYSLQYNRSSDLSWSNINLTYDTFVTSLGVGSWQTFDLNIFMATTSTKVDPLSLTVTFRSVIS